jgi:hypothetical protein
MAEQNYTTVTKGWSKDMPLWVLTEAQCKAKAIQQNRLAANAENSATCELLSLLVTGK